MKQWWNWRKRDAELEKEIQHHLQMAATERKERGASVHEAQSAARREFGNVELVKEVTRDRWGWRWLEDLYEDLRYGLRILRKSPGFTAVAILTLALGIGANTTIFSVIDAVLLRPLPYQNPSRLTMIWQSDAAHRSSGAWFNTYREFEEWRKQSKSFQKLAAFTWARVPTVIRLNGKPEHAVGIPVSADFFSALGVRAAYGRTFVPEDSQEACAAVLSNAFWRGELASAKIVGQTLTVNDTPCRILGIMPENFSFYPKQTQLWTLIPAQGEFAEHPWDSLVGVLGLLRPGVTPTSAQAELAELQSRIISGASPGLLALKPEPDVLDLQSEFVWLTGRNLRTSLIVLLAAVGFVLLIACVNVATLFLGRAAEREREFAVRAALGSTRLRVVRQLLTEALLLAVAGSALAILFAVAAIHYLNATNSTDLPPGNPVTLNWQVLLFTAALSIFAAFVFSLMPAREASRYEISGLLKAQSGGSQRAARTFIVAEVTLSLMLFAGASLMLESFFLMSSTKLGFEPANLLTADIHLPQTTYSSSQLRLNFFSMLKTKFAGIPGVAGITFAPIVPSGNNLLSVEERLASENTALGHNVREAVVDDDYFRVLAIRLLQGREFDSRDQQQTLPVAIVNEELAKEYLRGSPIGQHIKLGKPDDKSPWLTIVGVVGDVKSFTVFKEMAFVTDPCVYRPLPQDAPAYLSLFVRSLQHSGALSPKIRDAFSQMDPSLPPLDLITMNDWLAQFLAQPRFRAVLLSIFGVLGLVLSSIGIFGVLSQSVTQRRREIGIRVALGAQHGDTVRLVLREALTLTAIGIVLGVAAALTLTRAISSLLYGVSAADPLTLAAVALLIFVVALLACYLPARRATRVDPIVALRYE